MMALIMFLMMELVVALDFLLNSFLWLCHSCMLVVFALVNKSQNYAGVTESL